MIDDSVIPGPVRMGVANDHRPGWSGVRGAATAGGTVKGYRILRREVGFTSYVEIHDTLGDADPAATTRHNRTGYSFGDNNFGKATAQ